MLGAAFLDVATFEEVEHDQGATGQAAAVVVMVAAAQAIGSWGGGPSRMIGAALAALIGWIAWAGITWIIGNRVFGGTATWGEMLRTLGFAQSPGLLGVLGGSPFLGRFLSWFVPLWVAVAAFVAIRQALDFGNVKTFLTIVVGGAIFIMLSLLF
jgi:hypothetical protein